MAFSMQRDMHDPCFSVRKTQIFFVTWTDLVHMYGGKNYCWAFSYCMAEEAYQIPLGSSAYWEEPVIPAH